MFARRLEEVLIWIFVSAANTAFRVSVYVHNSNVHIRKAVYTAEIQNEQTEWDIRKRRRGHNDTPL